jgi:hypothetical protein
MMRLKKNIYIYIYYLQNRQNESRIAKLDIPAIPDNIELSRQPWLGARSVPFLELNSGCLHSKSLGTITVSGLHPSEAQSWLGAFSRKA